MTLETKTSFPRDALAIERHTEYYTADADAINVLDRKRINQTTIKPTKKFQMHVSQALIPALIPAIFNIEISELIYRFVS